MRTDQRKIFVLNKKSNCEKVENVIKSTNEETNYKKALIRGTKNM